MTGRDDVISHLQIIHTWATVDAAHGLIDSKVGEDVARWTMDAVKLLKAQEPRVLEVSEIAAFREGDVVWVEERQHFTWNLFPMVCFRKSKHPDTGTQYFVFQTYHNLATYDSDEYNQTWRCWASQPTGEQREAVKWNG